VTSSRHKQVVPPAIRRSLVRLAVPAAVATVLTGSVVGVAVGVGGTADDRTVQASAPHTPATPLTVDLDAADSPYLADRAGSISRSAKRVTLQAKPKVTDRQFMIAPLNLWPAPREKGRPLEVLPKGGRVALTGAVRAGFAQILRDGQVRWVNAAYLADAMPKPPKKKVVATPEAAPTQDTGSSAAAAAPSAPAGLSSAPCADGSSTESGLTSSAVRLFRAACAAFPALSSYGGYDGHGEHSSGRAIDFMVTDPGLGQALADWVRANASALGVYDVIWAQHIWTPVRASEGWRSMEDRGSATANHYDHVHVSVS
jgi:hypothetical protein